MNVGLQYGWGMQTVSRGLMRRWNGGYVVLSPRDIDADRLDSCAKEIRAARGMVLLDPQFYDPHGNHHRLVGHDIWEPHFDPATYWGTAIQDAHIGRIVGTSRALAAQAVILPGEQARHVTEEWLARLRGTIDRGRRLAGDLPQFATIALSPDAVNSDDELHLLLDFLRSADMPGVYLVLEQPSYIVDDPTWLTNALDLCAGIRLRGIQLIVGYSTQQGVFLAPSGAMHILSGTHRNVREFRPHKFRDGGDDEAGDHRRSATWYFCPSVFSEYKTSSLDVAWRQGFLADMAPSSRLGSTFADVVFSGAQPGSVAFGDRQAFQHYLQCLHALAAEATKPTFDETVSHQNALLDTAEKLLMDLRKRGVHGGDRDFFPAIVAHRAALMTLCHRRGPRLRRNWAHLIA